MSYNKFSNIEKTEKIDKNEFCTFIEKYQINMAGLAKSILLNEYDAEDAVETAIYKAYISRNTIRDINCFKSWILKIVFNESLSILKKKKKIIYMEQISKQNQIQEESETIYELWDAIQKLDDNYRNIIILFYYDDFSIKSISKVLNLTQSTVRVRLYRARQKLKLELLKQLEFINK